MARVLLTSLFQTPQPHRHEATAGLYAAESIAAGIEMTGHLRRVFDLWMTKRRDRSMPARREIDPIDLGGALPFVVLWDVARPGPQITCRVAGTEICHRAGRELRGLSPEASGGEQAASIRDEYAAVVATGQVHFVERRTSWFGHPLRAYRRIVLPLAGAGGEIDFLLSCIDFGDDEYRGARLN